MFRPIHLLLPLCIAASLTVSAPAWSGSAACPDDEFFAQLTKVNDWKALQTFLKHYLPTCPDDGVYGEGYSDKVVHMLARDWSVTGQLQEDHDPQFRAFVLKHIDATTDADDLKQVLHNATAQCPPGAVALCKDIAAHAAAAIKEL